MNDKTVNWQALVSRGIEEGHSISQIARSCYPIMGIPDRERAYNLVKKEFYRQKSRNGGEAPRLTPPPAGTVPATGVNSFSSKPNGEMVFEGFLKTLEGDKATPKDVLEACNVDADKWTIVTYTCNVWQGQTKETSGGNGKTCLWQFKVVLRPVRDTELSLDAATKAFEEELAKHGPPQYLPVKTLPPRERHKMLEINISDLHFAKLSWAPECGENYDYKIARDSFFQIIDAECRRLESGLYEKVLFVWTNDFFNSDTMDNTTTSGTAQNTDIRWQKMFLAGMRMLVEAIDKLQQYAPVETFYIASNHSRTTEWYGINFLYAWFHDNPRVEVDLTCKARHYYQYGVNLIGFTHGSYEKSKNLPSLMSVEVPQLWAQTSYREFHLAHIHSERVEEKAGIVFRWLPSVTAADAWHYDSGYLGAHKRSYSFTWDKEGGLEAIHVAHVKQKSEVK